MTNFTSTVTLTFGDVAENHNKMQKIGNLATVGFDYQDLISTQKHFTAQNCVTELIDLSIGATDPAYVLIIRNGVNTLLAKNNLNSDSFYTEQMSLDHDKKYFAYGTVRNKHARWNLCFGPYSQEPDYQSGKGRIIQYSDVPHVDIIRKSLPAFFGQKAENLVVEGNYYYDLKKTYIGFHGDSERRKVIAVRLGQSFPLHYQWYTPNSAGKVEPIGEPFHFMLNHGDMYVMSEKAVGTDWKSRKEPTLRHAAGDYSLVK